MDDRKRSLDFYRLLLLWFGLCHQGIFGQDDLTITALPSGRIGLGKEVTLICNARGRFSGSPVKWHMKRASYLQDIGSDQLATEVQTDLKQSVVRHRLIASAAKSDLTVHNLTITGTRPEDTAQYGCEIQMLSGIKWVNLAVCANPGGQVCQCLEKAGWLSPECYEEPPEIEAVEKRYKTTIIALIVFLVIAVLFGIGLAVMVGRDCMMRKYEKHKRASQQRNAANHIRASYAETDHLADPNETGSQVSSEGTRSSRQLPPTYTSLQHNNLAYAPGEEDLKYQEIGAMSNSRPHIDGAYGAGAADYQPHGGRMTVEAETHGDVPRERIKGRRAVPSSSSNGPRTPDRIENDSRGRYPSNDYGPRPVPPQRHFSPMEKPHSHVVNGDVRKSPGYQDLEPSYAPHSVAENPEWKRPGHHYNESPGTWSTQSAGEPFRYPDLREAGGHVPRNANLDPRNVYSEGPKHKYGPERAHYTEPRKLDFVHGQEAYNSNNNEQGPYIDKTDTVV